MGFCEGLGILLGVVIVVCLVAAVFALWDKALSIEEEKARDWISYQEDDWF